MKPPDAALLIKDFAMVARAWQKVSWFGLGELNMTKKPEFFRKIRKTSILGFLGFLKCGLKDFSSREKPCALGESPSVGKRITGGGRSH
jgi:hypothetical protein